MTKSWSRWWTAGLAVFFLLLFMANLAVAEETPVPATPAAMPTIDRLAAPPTVPSPTQADEGAYLYWLNCQPCHGDRGQGLTDEWRAQFPEEDQNCWQSGCHGTHGKEPPEDGFVLPTVVPALIGEGNNLARYGTLAQVYRFTRSAMPYEAPGKLPDEAYLAIMAFLARAHGIWDGRRLNAENIEQLSFKQAADGEPGQVGRAGEAAESENLKPAPTAGHAGSGWALPVGGIASIMLICLGAHTWRKLQR